MSLMFNTILRAAGFDLAQVRLLRHKDKNALKGRGPYQLWRDGQLDAYQRIQSFENAPKLKAEYWASFVVTPAGDTLFVGVFKVENGRQLDHDLPRPHMEGVDHAGSCMIYNLTLEPRLEDLVGMLVIDWGDGERAWIQRADRQDKRVAELRKAFKEPDFPGYLEFWEPLSNLEKLPVSWREILKVSRGVYLLTCPKTREQYVGSATGEGGFWQRWKDYVNTGHGGNTGLKSRDPSDYQVSILEVAGSADTAATIQKVEARWKAKLQSREMGLNRN